MSLKFGADPEYIVETQDNFGNGIFTPAFRAVTNGTSGRIGTDGNCEVGELRPDAHSSPLGVVANIGLLIKAMKESFNSMNVSVLAGHYKYSHPIGGHIHMSGFSMDMESLSFVCDYFLGGLSDIIDDQTEKKLRIKSGYGKGYREQGNNWMEYRAPGSWLLHPKTALGYMLLAEYCGFLYLKEKEAVNSNYIAVKTLLTSNKLPSKFTPDSLIHSLELNSKYKNRKILKQVINDLVSSTPIDWNVNIFSNWL